MINRSDYKQEINKLKFKHDLLNLFYQGFGYGCNELSQTQKYEILESIVEEMRHSKPHYLVEEAHG
jgi:hypothetical protein